MHENPEVPAADAHDHISRDLTKTECKTYKISESGNNQFPIATL